jgi:17 kDa outer membrane surface antigen
LAGVKTRCSQRRLYSGCAPARLWRAVPLAAGLTLALAVGGCSISTGQFDSLFSGSDKSDTTGSITPPPGAKGVGELPPDADLAFARAAASDVLNRGGTNASAPWENPRTGARGTVTPIASAYTQDGHTCRDFLASYVQGSSQAWMQGEACKQSKGAWEVRALKPWKRS